MIQTIFYSEYFNRLAVIHKGKWWDIELENGNIRTMISFNPEFYLECMKYKYIGEL